MSAKTSFVVTERRSTPCSKPAAADRQVSLQQAFHQSLAKNAVNLESCHDGTSGPQYTRELDALVNAKDEGSSSGVIALHGPPGNGKSTFLASWALGRHNPQEQRHVLTYFVGVTRHSTRLSDLLRFLCVQLNEKFKLRHEYIPIAERGLLHGLKCMLNQIKDKEDNGDSIAIVVDGVQHLLRENGKLAGLQWVPKVLPLNVKFIFSISVQDKQILEVELVENEDMCTTEPTSEGKIDPKPLGVNTDQAKSLKYQNGIQNTDSPATFLVAEQLLAHSAALVQFDLLNSEASVRKAIALLLGRSSGGGVLLRSHIETLVAEYLLILRPWFIFDSLNAVALATKQCYDIHKLVEECTGLDAFPANIQRSKLQERVLQFFSLGNYPLVPTVKQYWTKLNEEEEFVGEFEDSYELAQSRKCELCEILLGSSPGLLEGSTSENEYEEDFEAGSPLEDSTKSTEQSGNSPEHSDLNNYPVALLGGIKVEPVGDWLMNSCALIASARVGLSSGELEAALGVLSSEVQNTSSVASSLDDPQTQPVALEAFAENSFEAWLMQDSKEPSHANTGEAGAEADFKVPTSIRTSLFDILHGLVHIIVDEVMAIPWSSRHVRDAIDSCVVFNYDFAPNKEKLDAIAEDLSQARDNVEEPRFMKKREKSGEKRKKETKESNNDDIRHHKAAGLTDQERSNPDARWRLLLICAFKRRPRVERFAEEFPWLVCANYRPELLLSTLLDLQVLSVMCEEESILKPDLVRYWKKLASTCGSLKLEKEPEVKTRRARGESAKSYLSRISEEEADLPSPSGLDNSSENHQERTKPLATTKYDPVLYYSKVLEDFQSHVVNCNGANYMSDLEKVAEKAIEVGSILWELGEHEHLAPLYLHPPIHEERLVGINVSLYHTDPARLRAEDRSNLRLELSSTNSKLRKLAQGREGMILEQHLAQRQMALSKATSKSERETLAGHRRRSRYLKLLINQHRRMEETNSRERDRFGLEYQGNFSGSNFYSYQRWMWAQFPTIALANVSSIRYLTRRERTKSVALPQLQHSCSVVPFLSKSSGPGNAVNFWERRKKSLLVPNNNLSAPLNHIDISASRELSTSEEFQGGHVGGPISESPTPQHTASTPNLGSNFGSHEIHDHSFDTVSASISTTSSQAIPLRSSQEHCLRRKDTALYNFGAHNEEGMLKAIFHGGKILDDEAIRDTCDEIVYESGVVSVVSFVSANLPVHLQGYRPTEHEARVAELRGLETKLRKTLDKLRTEADQKEEALDQMLQEVFDRNELERHAQEHQTKGEEQCEEIENRTREMLADIRQAEDTGKFLQKVVELCEIFPGKVDEHTLAMEKRVNNMRLDRNALEQELADMSIHVRQMETVQFKDLQVAVEQRKTMHEEMLSRLRRWRDDRLEKMKDRRNRHANRKAVVKAIRDIPPSIEEAHTEWTHHRRKLYEDALEVDLSSLGYAEHLERQFRRLKHASKSNDPFTIAAKFVLHNEKHQQLKRDLDEALDKLEATKKRHATLAKQRTTAKASVVKGGSSKAVRVHERENEFAKARLKEAHKKYHENKAALTQVQAAVGALYAMLQSKGVKLSAVHQLPESVGDDPEDAARARSCIHAMLQALGVENAYVPIVPDFKLERPERKKPKVVDSKAERQRRKFLFGARPSAPPSLPPPILATKRKAF